MNLPHGLIGLKELRKVLCMVTDITQSMTVVIILLSKQVFCYPFIHNPDNLMVFQQIRYTVSSLLCHVSLYRIFRILHIAVGADANWFTEINCGICVKNNPFMPGLTLQIQTLGTKIGNGFLVQILPYFSVFRDHEDYVIFLFNYLFLDILRLDKV